MYHRRFVRPAYTVRIILLNIDCLYTGKVENSVPAHL